MQGRWFKEFPRFFQFSVDRAVDPTFWVGPNAQFFYVNEAASRLLGYSREELLKMSIYDIEMDLLKEEWGERWKRFKQEGSVVAETHHRSKKGDILPVEVTANYLEYQGKEFCCIFTRDISERKKAQENLRDQAVRDSLTGLYNRRHFDNRFENEIMRSKRTKRPLALLLSDLNNFKEINDTLGHQEGDRVLKKVAEIISASTRRIDLFYRWGGDEFAVILTETHPEGVRIVAERMVSKVEEMSQHLGRNFGLSVGAALFPKHGENAEDLIRLADRALYIAKKGERRLQIGEQEYLIDDRMINFDFQLVVDVKKNRAIGYEGLCRDATGKFSAPELFKRYQAVGKLKALRAHCFRSQLRAAEKLGLGRVFLNVDFKTLQQISAFPKPGNLEVILEISEAEVLSKEENYMEIAESWRKNGFKMALDDFGAGFISLPFIEQLLPDYIKLDRTLVLRAVDSREFHKFLKGMVRALKTFAAEGIVAEGVETKKELHVVKELGVQYAQGFFFGKPIHFKNGQ